MKTYSTSPGCGLQLGATIVPDGVNFAVFSRHGEMVTLVLFDSGEGSPSCEIALDPAVNRTGDIWHILVEGVGAGLCYGYRVAGPYDPDGRGHYFSSETILLDPYSHAVTGGEEWGRKLRPDWKKFRSLVVDEHFDWQGDRPLNIPLKDSVIYEMHVRGFTRHTSSGVAHPGTFAGVIEKIPYLLELGVNAVELMPVTEFNENEDINRDPVTGEQLRNLWGYSPLAFFAPKAAYAADNRRGNQVREFREMVKALHRAGIEVILDVVFNHTAEGGANGPVTSFRGLDNVIYYLLDKESRHFLNFSGCGNTMNCNHPLVRNLIMDCLRYWVTEMHVDGFRFDLASILGRDRQGHVLSNPPMVEQIAEDPILADTKIIAEAWDAAGLYQVGTFAAGTRWAEWNGHFRDDLRDFMRGEGSVARLATRIAGSSDLYQQSSRSPASSINFLTSHDGFTLADLVSYNGKHNERNGEENRDGSNHNSSWNSGHEGPTANARIRRLRARRMRSFAALLFLSQGVPMFVAGEEFGRTQGGNNNAYCQDNVVGWVDWRLAEENADLLRYFRLLIALRKAHPVFRRCDFFSDPAAVSTPEISWYSSSLGQPDWSATGKTLAFFLNGGAVDGSRDDDFFVMINGGMRVRSFAVPSLTDSDRTWFKIIDTAAEPPEDILPEQQGAPVSQAKVKVAGLGVVVLISKPGFSGGVQTP